MNTIKSFQISLGLLIALVGFYSLTSCEEESVGAPVIYQVRSNDPAAADSFFTASEPGQLIVVQGKNFTGLLQIFFNEVEASFNSALNSDKNVIVWIPAEVPLSAINPEAPNTIRMVTKTGSCTFSFRFLAPAPTISFFDFTLPLEVGNEMGIVGTNYYEVKRVYYARENDTTEITGYTVSADYKRISFSIAEYLQYNGVIGVITESGHAWKDFTPNPPPEIRGFSNDLPVQGDEFSIYGVYFTLVDRIVFPNGTVVPRNEIQFDATFTTMTLTNPKSATAGKLLLITSLGDTNTYEGFNSRLKVLYDFDGRGNWVWDATFITTAGTQSGEEPLLANGNFYRITKSVPTNTDWWQDGVLGMSVMWPSVSAIPATTLTKDMAFQILINSELPWNQGYFRITIGTAEYFLTPWETGPVPPVDKWVLYTIPLSDFSNMTYATFDDILALDANNAVLVMFKTTNADEEFLIDMCIDDIRLTILE